MAHIYLNKLKKITRNLNISVPVLALLTIAIIYSGALKNKLVADSWVFVYPHTFIETCAYFFKSIIPPEWKSLFLRPIPMFFFWLDNKLWPGTAWGPHLTNVIFHVINSFLIWKLILLLSRTKSAGSRSGDVLPALAACLVYGLHPLTVGSVAWVAARFDVMSITFGLTGLLLWLKHDAGRSVRGGFFTVSLMLLLSLLSKEHGVVFIAACFIAAAYGFLLAGKNRKRSMTGIILPGLLFIFYALYRLVIFSGPGGYLTARHGLNFRIPAYYFLAAIFPFQNGMPGWTLSWTLCVSVITLGTLVFLLWNSGIRERADTNLRFTAAAASIFIFGLITTTPHAGLTLERIMGHAESRFALIPVTGLSLLIGIGALRWARSLFAQRILLIFLFFLGAAFLWRTDVQLQAWKKAGVKADSIIRQTLDLAPKPPRNSQLIFLKIPRNNEQYAYIFGIGLKEALRYKYGCRKDINVIRSPKRRDLGTAIPERDFVFQYHEETGTLERLTAVKKKKGDKQ